MELAKLIIGNKIKIDNSFLSDIALLKTNPKWTRIAAIYSLGFMDRTTVATALRSILSDNDDDADIRAHAAEALGNLRDRAAAVLLQSILAHNPSDALRASCEYALHELGAS
jgi:HEAT repeat protein